MTAGEVWFNTPYIWWRLNRAPERLPQVHLAIYNTHRKPPSSSVQLPAATRTRMPNIDLQLLSSVVYPRRSARRPARGVCAAETHNVVPGANAGRILSTVAAAQLKRCKNMAYSKSPCKSTDRPAKPPPSASAHPSDSGG